MRFWFFARPALKRSSRKAVQATLFRTLQSNFMEALGQVIVCGCDGARLAGAPDAAGIRHRERSIRGAVVGISVSHHDPD
jgi:hypothetical protein